MVFRSSKSCWTVSFSKPVTKMFCAFSKSFLSASRSFSLSDFFFMMDLSSRPLASELLGVERCDVQVDARAHGGADGHALDVFALGRRGLGLDHRLDQAVRVFEQLAGLKTNFA